MLLVKNSAQLQQLIPALPRVHVTSCWWGNEEVCWTCSTTEQHRFSTVHTVWNHCGTPGASLQEVKEVQHIGKRWSVKLVL